MENERDSIACYAHLFFFNDYFGAKTVPRNQANKNTQNKNSDFMLIFAIESIENTTKKRYSNTVKVDVL